MSDENSEVRIKLEKEAKALAALKGGKAHRLADRWYVVMPGKNGDSAYEVFGAGACAEVREGSSRIAVRYYVVTERTLLNAMGQSVLTPDQIKAVAYARECWIGEE